MYFHVATCPASEADRAVVDQHVDATARQMGLNNVYVPFSGTLLANPTGPKKTADEADTLGQLLGTNQPAPFEFVITIIRAGTAPAKSSNVDTARCNTLVNF